MRPPGSIKLSFIFLLFYKGKTTMNNKKIVLIGNGGVGKTTWVKSIYGNFDESYKPTLGVEVHPITYGDTRFNIWDTAG